MEKEVQQSFLVDIKFLRNSTWQGSVKWLNEDKKQNFRSLLELIKLIDETLETSQENTVAWDNKKELSQED